MLRRYSGGTPVPGLCPARAHVALVVLIATLATSIYTPAAQAQKPTLPITVLPLRISSVNVQNGQLVANGTLGHTSFTAPITLSATPSADPK